MSVATSVDLVEELSACEGNDEAARASCCKPHHVWHVVTAFVEIGRHVFVGDELQAPPAEPVEPRRTAESMTCTTIQTRTCLAKQPARNPIS